MRPIDADALFKKMKEDLRIRPEEFATRVHAIQSKALNRVASAPTIEAKPIVHSYWHYMASGYNGMEDPFMCDNCCYTMEAENIMENHNALRHCSSCGARMDYVDTTAGKIKIREEDEDG